MPTVGQQLRETRESLQLDIQQVAEATKLKTDHVRALEEGDFSAFTAQVYLRGSLRTYARLLKLDSAALLNQLETELGGSAEADQPAFSPPRSRSPVDSVMLLLSRVNWIVAAVIIVVAVAAIAGTAGYRAWRAQKASDPLKKLGPGLYQPPRGGEVLPIPTNSPRS